jgi:hypothetical protein
VSEHDRIIASLRKLEQEQREIKRALRCGRLWWQTGLTQPVMSALQRESAANQGHISAIHDALAMCRNRLRRSAAAVSWLDVREYVKRLASGLDREEDGGQAAFYAWRNWCRGWSVNGLQPSRPEARPWQAEFVRRERKARKQRKAAGNG